MVTTLSNLYNLSALYLPSLNIGVKGMICDLSIPDDAGHVDKYFPLYTCYFSSTRGHNYKVFKPQSSCLSRSRFLPFDQ